MTRHTLLSGPLAAARLLACLVALGSAVAYAQSVPAVTGSQVPQASAQLALDFHNAKRHDVAVQPLEWSPELATVAQNWANHLASTGCELQHTQHSKYGENLFGGNGMPFTALDAAKDWYSETAKFKYGVLTPANWSASGHYTQMVWNHSTHMGMGQASCKDGSIVIVAEYNPAGNYMGQAPYDARPSALATEPAK